MTQEDLLLPWKTVLDNAIMGQAIATPHDVNKEQAAALLAELGLGDVLDAFPDTLSVGMRQRVSLARALLNGSQLLLLDEPFSALDVATRHQLYQVLRRIHLERSMTIVLATHDFSDALALADRILLVADGCVAKAWDIPTDCRTVPAQRLKWQEALKEAFFLQINSKNS
jgi:ABC-type nitrate/sulfonate/bicarbonate transport system ATPase subunit